MNDTKPQDESTYCGERIDEPLPAGEKVATGGKRAGVSRRVREMHARAAAEYAKCGTMCTALKRAGASDATAHHHQARTFRRIANNPDNARLLAKGKVTEARLGRKLGALLEAERKTVDGDGCVVTVPDNAVQLRATELCLKLGKYLKDGDDGGQVLVLVMQQLVPVIMPFVPVERHAELAEAVQAFGQR